MKKTIIIMSFLLFFSNIARSKVHIIARHQDLMAIVTERDAHTLIALVENTDFYQNGKKTGHLNCSLKTERCTIAIYKNIKGVLRNKNYLVTNTGTHKRLFYLLDRYKYLAFDNGKIIFELKENNYTVAILEPLNSEHDA